MALAWAAAAWIAGAVACALFGASTRGRSRSRSAARPRRVRADPARPQRSPSTAISLPAHPRSLHRPRRHSTISRLADDDVAHLIGGPAMRRPRRRPRRSRHRRHVAALRHRRCARSSGRESGSPRPAACRSAPDSAAATRPATSSNWKARIEAPPAIDGLRLRRVPRTARHPQRHRLPARTARRPRRRHPARSVLRAPPRTLARARACASGAAGVARAGRAARPAISAADGSPRRPQRDEHVAPGRRVRRATSCSYRPSTVLALRVARRPAPRDAGSRSRPSSPTCCSSGCRRRSCAARSWASLLVLAQCQRPPHERYGRRSSSPLH